MSDQQTSSTSNSSSSTSVPGKSEFSSSFLLSDEEILKLGVKKDDLELYRRKHYQLMFGISTWYNQLKEHTFVTEMLQLSQEEAKSLGNRKPTPQDDAILSQLTKKIDQVIKTKFPNGAFVKLNTRSPKDVPVYDFRNKSMQEILEKEIEKEPTKLNDLNHRVWSFIKTTSKVLKVSTGEQAMELLRRSDRIHEDLNKLLYFSKINPSLSEAQLVFREWLDECSDRPEYEFRGFVNDKKLNALSMYFCVGLSTELVERADHVQRLILQFFDQIKHKIPHESFVIDFYVTKSDKVMVIELNPFHIGAGPCMFSWKDDREKFLRGPFEFRIIRQVPEIAKEIIPRQWQRIIMAKYGPIQNSNTKVDEESSSWSWKIGVVVVAVTISGLIAFLYKR